MESHQIRAIAWRLHAPSVSGGKIYTIGVVGNDLIVAWGRASINGPFLPGGQTKVEPHQSQAAAMAAAQERTNEKQKRGYVIDIAPRQHLVRIMPVGTTLYQILRDGTDVVPVQV